MLRYQENNELHMDFHGTTAMSIDYIVKNYGEDAIKQILRKTGRDVYKSIHEKLKKDDPSELLEHLVWFYNREKAPFKLSVTQDEIRFEVLECPAVKHLKKLGMGISPYHCLQTSEVNAGMCEDSPWESSVEMLGEGHCVQIFRRRKAEAAK